MPGNREVSLTFRVIPEGTGIFDETGRQIAVMGEQAEGASRKATDGFSRLQRTVLVGTAAIVGARVAWEAFQRVAGAPIAAAAEVESLETRLISLTGSEERAAAAYERFAGIASRTPFELRGVVEAGVALESFTGQSEALLGSVVDLAAFMGTDAVAAAQSVGRAWAAGAGAADILRERGVLALVSMRSGFDDLTKLSLPEFRKVLFEAMVDPAGKIAGSADRLADTWNGAMSNISDATFTLQAELGNVVVRSEAVHEIAVRTAEGIRGLAGEVREWTDANREAIDDELESYLHGLEVTFGAIGSVVTGAASAMNTFTNASGEALASIPADTTLSDFLLAGLTGTVPTHEGIRTNQQDRNLDIRRDEIALLREFEETFDPTAVGMSTIAESEAAIAEETRKAAAVLDFGKAAAADAAKGAKAAADAAKATLRAIAAEQSAIVQLAETEADLRQASVRFAREDFEILEDRGAGTQRLIASAERLDELERQALEAKRAVLGVEIEQLQAVQDLGPLLPEQAAGLGDLSARWAIVTEEIARSGTNTEELIDRIREAETVSINLGGELAGAGRRVIDGVLAGGGNGFDAGQIALDTSRTFVTNFFGEILEKKLDFDLKFDLNFRKDLPAVVASGSDKMASEFDSGLDRMVTSAGQGTASLGDIFTGAFDGIVSTGTRAAGSLTDIFTTVPVLGSLFAPSANGVPTILSQTPTADTTFVPGVGFLSQDLLDASQGTSTPITAGASPGGASSSLGGAAGGAITGLVVAGSALGASAAFGGGEGASTGSTLGAGIGAIGFAAGPIVGIITTLIGAFAGGAIGNAVGPQPRTREEETTDTLGTFLVENLLPRQRLFPDHIGPEGPDFTDVPLLSSVGATSGRFTGFDANQERFISLGLTPVNQPGLIEGLAQPTFGQTGGIPGRPETFTFGQTGFTDGPGQPGVSDLRFTKGLTLGLLLEDTSELVLDVANSSTANLQALDVSVAEASNQFDIAIRAAAGTLEEGVQIISTRFLEDLPSEEGARAAFATLIDAFAGEIPDGLDVATILERDVLEPLLRGVEVLDIEGAFERANAILNPLNAANVPIFGSGITGDPLGIQDLLATGGIETVYQQQLRGGVVGTPGGTTDPRFFDPASPPTTLPPDVIDPPFVDPSPPVLVPPGLSGFPPPPGWIQVAGTPGRPETFLYAPPPGDGLGTGTFASTGGLPPTPTGPFDLATEIRTGGLTPNDLLFGGVSGLSTIEKQTGIENLAGRTALNFAAGDLSDEDRRFFSQRLATSQGIDLTGAIEGLAVDFTKGELSLQQFGFEVQSITELLGDGIPGAAALTGLAVENVARNGKFAFAEWVEESERLLAAFDAIPGTAENIRESIADFRFNQLDPAAQESFLRDRITGNNAETERLKNDDVDDLIQTPDFLTLYEQIYEDSLTGAQLAANRFAPGTARGRESTEFFLGAAEDVADDLEAFPTALQNNTTKLEENTQQMGTLGIIFQSVADAIQHGQEAAGAPGQFLTSEGTFGDGALSLFGVEFLVAWAQTPEGQAAIRAAVDAR